MHDITKSVSVDNGCTTSVAESGERGRVRHALLVDDSPVNLMILKKILTDVGGFDFSTAGNGREALVRLEERTAAGQPFDVVFTDIWMPEMTGEKFVCEIRSDARFANLPVYAMTTDQRVHASYAQLGFDGCCLKPYAIDGLRGMLQNVG